MTTLTIGLAEAKNNFSKVTATVNQTGKSVTVMRNNKPWVVISPAAHVDSTEAGADADDAVDMAVDFMDEYADVFQELAK